MNAIASPCFELFTCTGQRLGFCSNGVSIARHDTAFLGHRTSLGRGFRLTVTFQNKHVRPISAAQTNAETEQVETSLTEECETVRVRFKLQKECAFGQEFILVGDDEVLGSWNPSDGVSLTWSEGHMWTTEVDLPVNKVIKYKFILKGLVGAVSWQPGPDRILKTWETEKMISVSEDWNNPGLQNVVEDEPADDPIETDSNSSIVDNAENSNSEKSIEKTPKANADAKNQVKANNQAKNSATKAAKKVTKRAQKENLRSNDKASLSSDDKVSAQVSQADSEKKEMISEDNEEAPVLVPGLMPEEEIEEAELDEAEAEAEAATPIDNEVLAKPELNTECPSASAPLRSSGSNGETIIDEKQQLNDKQQHGERIIDEKQQPGNILETDMQWGKQTLYKFLSKFRFQ